MSDYTPTTTQVRDAYVRAMRNAFIASAGEHGEEFDRWLDGQNAALLDSVASDKSLRLSGHSGVSVRGIRDRATAIREGRA